MVHALNERAFTVGLALRLGRGTHAGVSAYPQFHGSALTPAILGDAFPFDHLVWGPSFHLRDLAVWGCDYSAGFGVFPARPKVTIRFIQPSASLTPAPCTAPAR